MLFSPSRSLKVPKPFLPNPKAPKLPNAQLTQNQKHEQLDSSSFTGLRKLRSSYLTGRALSLSLLPPSFLSPGLGSLSLSLSLNLCLYKNMYTHIYIHTHTYLSRESCSKDSSAFHDLSNCQLNGFGTTPNIHAPVCGEPWLPVSRDILRSVQPCTAQLADVTGNQGL